MRPPANAHRRARSGAPRWALPLIAALTALVAAGVIGGVSARPVAAAGSLAMRTLSIAEGLPHPAVYAIARDPFGFLWLGTLEGLARYDGYGFVVYRPDPSNPNMPVSGQIDTLATDRAGMLLSGVGFFQDRVPMRSSPHPSSPLLPHGEQGEPPQIPLPDAVRSPSPAQGEGFGVKAPAKTLHLQTGMLWIGTLASGLNRYDPYSEQFTLYRHDPNDPYSLSSDAVRAIHEDAAGHLWIGTLDGGLNRLDLASGRFTNYRHDPNDPTTPGSNTVLALYADPAGMLWAATWNGGLNRIDPASGRFTRYTVADGLRSAKINGIQPDDAGNLWLTSNQGLMRFDPRTGQSVAYTTASVGLPPGGLALNGSTRTRAGELIFGGFDSLVTFFPRDVRPQTAVAPVVFTTILVSNRPLAVGPTSPLTTTINAASELTLLHRDRVLSLEFAALDYRAPGAARYRYRLVGFAPEWVEDLLNRVVTKPARCRVLDGIGCDVMRFVLRRRLLTLRRIS
jgi:hypothetical protein